MHCHFLSNLKSRSCEYFLGRRDTVVLRYQWKTLDAQRSILKSSKRPIGVSAQSEFFHVLFRGGCPSEVTTNERSLAKPVARSIKIVPDDFSNCVRDHGGIIRSDTADV